MLVSDLTDIFIYADDRVKRGIAHRLIAIIDEESDIFTRFCDRRITNWWSKLSDESANHIKASWEDLDANQWFMGFRGTHLIAVSRSSSSSLPSPTDKVSFHQKSRLKAPSYSALSSEFHLFDLRSERKGSEDWRRRCRTYFADEMRNKWRSFVIAQLQIFFG